MSACLDGRLSCCLLRQSPIYIAAVAAASSAWTTQPPLTKSCLTPQGIAKVDAQHAGQDTVHFVDRLLFLVGRKGSRAAVAGAGIAEAAAAEKVPQVLSPQQAVQYHEQGFCGPLDILTPTEAATALACFEEYERRLGGKITAEWRFKSHLLLPWCERDPAVEPMWCTHCCLRPSPCRMWDLACHPRLLAAVSMALGGVQNLLCWSSDIFVKDPATSEYTSWHQDSTYVHLDPVDDVITAW